MEEPKRRFRFNGEEPPPAPEPKVAPKPDPNTGVSPSTVAWLQEAQRELDELQKRKREEDVRRFEEWASKPANLKKAQPRSFNPIGVYEQTAEEKRSGPNLSPYEEFAASGNFNARPGDKVCKSAAQKWCADMAKNIGMPIVDAAPTWKAAVMGYFTAWCVPETRPYIAGFMCKCSPSARNEYGNQYLEICKKLRVTVELSQRELEDVVIVLQRDRNGKIKELGRITLIE